MAGVELDLGSQKGYDSFLLGFPLPTFILLL